MDELKFMSLLEEAGNLTNEIKAMEERLKVLKADLMLAHEANNNLKRSTKYQLVYHKKTEVIDFSKSQFKKACETSPDLKEIWAKFEDISPRKAYISITVRK